SGGNAFALAQAEEARKAQQQLNDLINETPVGKLKQLEDAEKLVADAFAAGNLSAEQHEQVLKIIGQRYADLLGPIEKAADQLSEFTKQAQRNIQDALGDS